MLNELILNENIISNIKLEIKQNLSPKHVPAKIYQVSDIPKTKSGKITELIIKNIINGEKNNNLSTLSNPDCLKDYIKLKTID